jgi:hypothetical protein
VISSGPKKYPDIVTTTTNKPGREKIAVYAITELSLNGSRERHFLKAFLRTVVVWFSFMGISFYFFKGSKP